MHRNKKLLVVMTMWLISVAGLAFSAERPANSPVGYWKTMDNVTGKPKSIVQIWKTADNRLMGKVIKLYPSSGVGKPALCTACQGEQHNQPVIGMVILSGLMMEKSLWNTGKMLDPDNGKIYKCSARLTENGKRLSVEGYIGLPLFGRSQTWERVDLMTG